MNVVDEARLVVHELVAETRPDGVRGQVQVQGIRGEARGQRGAAEIDVTAGRHVFPRHEPRAAVAVDRRVPLVGGRGRDAQGRACRDQVRIESGRLDIRPRVLREPFPEFARTDPQAQQKPLRLGQRWLQQ